MLTGILAELVADETLDVLSQAGNSLVAKAKSSHNC